jgi:bifunctional non-homologous end joining protein LigD
MSEPQKISLFYSEGKSDKEYHASLEAKDNGFIVNFAYGRRGSTLTTGTKTEKPVPFEKAKAAFDKLVNEKLAKGYSPGESGTPYQHTDKEQRQTGILPQLLNETDDVEQWINHPDWWAQEKFDGKRVLIRIDREGVTGINRSGLTIGLPLPIIEAVSGTVEIFKSENTVLDGECIGDTFHTFDLLFHAATGGDIRDLSYDVRLLRLIRLLEPNKNPNIQLAHTATTPNAKRTLYNRLRDENREGIVFKNKDAAYKAGRPSSGGSQLKFKFTATASCMVSRVNGSKRSVALALIDGHKSIGVGNVTIPPNFKIPAPKSIVEVRYLYAYKGGSLYQPVYLGERDDIDVKACKLSQLKYKSEEE